MATDNPYQALVEGFARLLSQGEALSPAGLIPPKRAPVAANAPTALIFAPHPDDEVIIGGLPLRLLRELKLNVVNVAVTLGSRAERRAERWQELKNCCDYIGFGLVAAGERGLEGINPIAREQNPQRWSAAVKAIADVLSAQRPLIIFFPHDDDWNKTHIGVHHLVLEALGSSGLACQVVETEFWGAMDTPNLMVESSTADVSDLVAALSLHTGEVTRNPYHLRLPAWMMDNVRRGAELVGGQGGAAPRFTFATLYRLRRWANGRLQKVLERSQALSSQDDLSKLFLTSMRN
ncbi:MAG: PIG-L family deacetylase [Acetobacteraceae bacterium]|nr:PIG-L family deacetylase [Acetobacteraceae bacterium]